VSICLLIEILKELDTNLEEFSKNFIYHNFHEYFYDIWNDIYKLDRINSEKKLNILKKNDICIYNFLQDIIICEAIITLKFYDKIKAREMFILVLKKICFKIFFNNSNTINLDMIEKVHLSKNCYKVLIEFSKTENLGNLILINSKIEKSLYKNKNIDKTTKYKFLI